MGLFDKNRKKCKDIYCNLVNICCCGGVYFAVNENNEVILKCDDCEMIYDNPDDVLNGEGYRANEKTRPATIEEIKNKGWTKYIEKQNIKDNK